MFERFSGSARHAVIEAQEVAHQRQVSRIGSLELLEAIARGGGDGASDLLAQLGVDRQRLVTALGEHRVAGAAPDGEALASIGIDLDQVRAVVDDTFGEGALQEAANRRVRGRRRRHLPFERSTKKALEIAVREAAGLRRREIRVDHVLLGLLHRESGAAHDVLSGLGVTLDAARTAVASRGNRATA